MLTSCLFCVDSASLRMLNVQQFYMFSQIRQTNQARGQLCSHTTPYGECSFASGLVDPWPWNTLVESDEQEDRPTQ